MTREHDHRRAPVVCSDCGRVLVGQLIEPDGAASYWQPIGIADRGCPECGGDEYEPVSEQSKGH